MKWKLITDPLCMLLNVLLVCTKSKLEEECEEIQDEEPELEMEVADADTATQTKSRKYCLEVKRIRRDKNGRLRTLLRDISTRRKQYSKTCKIEFVILLFFLSFTNQQKHTKNRNETKRNYK